MSDSLRTLDVRPILKSGGEPFAEIMKALAELESGQGLRLLATFKPMPLFAVMESKGYSHCEKELEGGDWEVIFRPTGAASSAPAPAASMAAESDDVANWPAPSQVRDMRDMLPPDPLVITLETVEGMAVGEVMEGCYDRDPLLLYPELDARGYPYHTEKRAANEYHVLIRRSAAAEGAP